MNHVIIAPHPDDEVIGCYQLLAAGAITHVLYLRYSLAELSRREEACNSANYFGVQPMFSAADLTPILDDSILYLPAITDAHAQHRETNVLFRSYGVDRYYYSVDLDQVQGKKPLADSEARAKRNALDYLYPSQASLWANDASYYLFENVVHLDYDVLRPHQVCIKFLGVYSDTTILMREADRLHFTTVTHNQPQVFSSLEEIAERLIGFGITRFKIQSTLGEIEL